MKNLLLILFITLSLSPAFAGNKIRFYFNKPVDTTVSTGKNAVYLRNCIADTLVAYLNRAHYSLDICMYDFEKTLSYNIDTLDTVFAPKIAASIDSAYTRGVKIRYIYEASNANTGLSLIDTAHIHTLGSPQGTNYTIMHNKFVIIDAKSPDHNAPTVWTGCLNWYYEQFNWDYNNVVTIQDSALANAYTSEFNMMWGDTGIIPNPATSKFGMFKTDLGNHTFNIDGNLVELYFSPSDGTDSHIQSTIMTADKDLYFGMYTFTVNTDANLISSKSVAGVYVAGVDDSWSNGYGPYSIFTSGLGSNFKVYNEAPDTIFHNKYMIVDPSDTCSDPLVLTGSHNWTNSANTHNDENTLIIHSASAANQYYQYFKATFNMLGGTLTPPAPSCTFPALTPISVSIKDNLRVYPNPSTGDFGLSFYIPSPEYISAELYSITGKKVGTIFPGAEIQAGKHEYKYSIDSPGLYFIHFIVGSETFEYKLIIIN